MLRLILFISIFFGFFSSWAQTIQVVGTVTNSNGNPIANAFLWIQSEGKTAISDQKGEFRLELPKKKANLELVVTHLSYIGTSVKFDSSQDTVLSIQMMPQPHQLETFEFADNAQNLNFEWNQQEVSAQDITTHSKGTLVNSIEFLPGINAINVGVGIAKPIIRGMSFNRLSVQQDGVQQEGQQWGADHGLEIDQNDVENLEVIKGPAVLKYGGDAIGGLVRILPSSIADSNSTQVALKTEYKTNNQHIGLSPSLKMRKEKWFLNARFSSIDFGDYRVPTDKFRYNTYVLPIFDETLKNTAGAERNVNLENGWIYKKGITRIKVSNYLLRAGIFPGAIGIPRSYNLQPDGDNRNIDLPSQRVEHTKVVARTVYNFAPNVRNEWVLGFQNNLRNEYSAPHAHGNARPPATNRALKLQLQTFDAQWNQERELSGLSQLEWGVSGQIQSNEIGGFEFLVPAYQKDSWGGFAIWEQQISIPFSISAGTRFDFSRINAEKGEVVMQIGANDQADLQTRSEAFTREFWAWAASIRADYEVNNQQFSLQLAKSNRMPSIAELASNGIHHGTFRHEKGDANLQLEEAYQADANYLLKTNKWQVSVGAFYHFFDNYLYLNPTSRFSTLPEAGQLFEFTSTQAIFTGGELAISRKLGEYFTLKTNIDGVYNVNLKNDLGLPFTPPASSYSAISFEKSVKNNWKIGGDVNYRYTFDQNRVERNEPATAGYQLVGASTFVQGDFNTWNFRFQISVQNLTDVPYWVHTNRYRWVNIPEQGKNFLFSLLIRRKLSKR